MIQRDSSEGKDQLHKCDPPPPQFNPWSPGGMRELSSLKLLPRDPIGEPRHEQKTNKQKTIITIIVK